MLNSPVSKRDHTIGPWNAKVVMVEYSDFECPYCAAAEPVFRALRETLSDCLLFAYRHFPLAEAHPHALHAAEASEAAGAQGKFWEMHDLLYENQENLGESLFLELGDTLDLSSSQLLTAIAAHTYQDRVRTDFRSGVRSGVNGTPTFFINGVRHDGSYDFATLTEAIESVLHPGA